MTDIKIQLKRFEEISNNPGKMLKKYSSEGVKTVGCFPLYAPKPLIHAGGMVPMGLWGGQVSPAKAGKYNPIFTCSIMRSCLEFGMTGVYEGLSVAIMPMLCDTFRGTISAWKAGVEDIPIIGFVHPQNRMDSGAKEFMAAEYESVRKRIEKITGQKIDDDSIMKSIELYNEHNKIMREFAELANSHLDIITPWVRHNIFKSAQFIRVEEHLEMMKKLLEELSSRQPHEWRGKKIILSGITAEPKEFLEIFEENNIAVVGDDIAQQSRQYMSDFDIMGTPMESLASQWFNHKHCSSAHEEDTRIRGKMILNMVERTQADAVAICLMRFCDIEEYEYPYIAKMLEKNDITCLCLEIDQSTQDNGQSKTKIQTFSEF